MTAISRLAAVAAGGLFLCGCATSFKWTPEHTLVFGSNGRPRVPLSQQFGALQKDLREESEDEYRAHLDLIFDTIRVTPPPAKCPDTEQPGVKRVLVYVHGGLINYGPALTSVTRMLEQPDDGRRIQDCFYPVFVNWRSSLVSTYSDHLFAIRQGRRQPAVARLTSPLAFADDLFNLPFGFLGASGELVSRGEGAIDPSLPADQTCGTDAMTEAVPREHPQVETYKGAQQAIQKDAARSQQLRNGICRRPAARGVRDYAQRIPFFVFKPVTASIIDTFGEPAARIMNRRTEVIFEPEGCLRRATPAERLQCRDWSLTQFFRRLTDEATANGWEVTLVGHSMGTIVVNEALRRFPRLNARNVVYMAAALTIEDYEDANLRGPDGGYLGAHPDTRFYHLTLHRLAEVRERQWMDAVPRGSLLQWLDAFINRPIHERQLTAGRALNIVPTLLDLPEGVVDRVHIKEFDYGEKLPCHPQQHGEFNDMLFWRRAFWEPFPKEGVEAVPENVCRLQ
jgi:pimeloyl-ACP methyl ester carboxylesterase